MPKVNPNSVAGAAMLAEQIWCYEQRLGGMTERQIHALFPERFGYAVSQSTIHHRLRAEGRERLEARDEKRAELVAYEVDKLDRYLLGLHDLMRPTTVIMQSIDGNSHEVEVTQKPEVRIGAFNTAIRLQERRSKLLGLDAPTVAEIAVSIIDPTDLELSKLVAKMEKADRKAAKQSKRNKAKAEVQ